MGEAAWVLVQRDWREQGRAEAQPAGPGIEDPRRPHHARPGDGRFAALASRPYESLGRDELVRLMQGNAAQRQDRERAGHVGRTLGVGLACALVGFGVGGALVLHAISSSIF